MVGDKVDLFSLPVPKLTMGDARNEGVLVAFLCQRQTLFRPFNPDVRITKTELSNLDLLYLPKMSALHDYLTPDGEIDLPTDPPVHKNDTDEPLYRQPRQR